MLLTAWHIDLFGGLRVYRGEVEIRRFRTKKTGELLAYLAFHLGETRNREEIAGILWPEADEYAGRASLRTALASLRHQLEPPGTPANSVLLATRSTAGLEAGAVSSDLSQFRQFARSGDESPLPNAISAFSNAVDLYQGSLLEGCYEEWVVSERHRLEHTYLSVLSRLVDLLEQAEDLHRAIEYAVHLVSHDPLCDESHRTLIRLYARIGQPAHASKQLKVWEGTVEAELGQGISDEDRREAERWIGGAEAVERNPRRPTLTGKEYKADVTRLQSDQPRGAVPDLPISLTSFIGRESELLQIARLVTGWPDSRLPSASDGVSRLVTITGPGGAGKTRLAIEAARSLAPQFNNEVVFVPLADAATAHDLPVVVARAIRANTDSHLEPLEMVKGTLGNRRLLLVLDNIEQLIESDLSAKDAAYMIRSMLLADPALVCIVTSRRRLDIEGEQEFSLRPLPVPTHPAALDMLMEFAGVELFVDRAQAARADFQLTKHNQDAVLLLCRRLEGIPLAIELAAAWVHALSPGQILERLASRFDILISRRKGVEARHQTLHAAIDWSYQLLSPELQSLFADLAVFRGTWSVADAEAVLTAVRSGGGSDTSEVTILKAIESLTTCSLFIAEETPLSPEYSEMRFRMLEAIREYGLASLSVERRKVLNIAHFNHLSNLAFRSRTNSSTNPEGNWFGLLDLMNDNLRGAIDWALENNHPFVELLDLTEALIPYWWAQGRLVEARLVIDQILVKARTEGDLCIARALSLASTLAWYCSAYDDAQRLAAEALAIAQSQHDDRCIADALVAVGNAVTSVGELQNGIDCFMRSSEIYRKLKRPLQVADAITRAARSHVRLNDLQTVGSILEEAAELFKSLGEVTGLNFVLLMKAFMMMENGENRAAYRLTNECVDARRKWHLKPELAYALTVLGQAARRAGELKSARDHYQESLEVWGSLDNRQGLASAHNSLGDVYRLLERFKDSYREYTCAIDIRLSLGDQPGVAGSAGRFACLCSSIHRCEDAARLFAAFDTLSGFAQSQLPVVEALDHDECRSIARAELSSRRYDICYAEGQLFTINDVAAIARQLPVGQATL